MFAHGPSCLSGPVTRTRDWWLRSPAGDPVLDGPDRGVDTKPPAEVRPIRKALVARVRREIAAGTYETPAKWDKALDRLEGRGEV